MPLFDGKLDQDRKWLFMSYSRNGLESGPFRCFIRDQRWKLYSTGELYDVPNDWLEQYPASGLEADAARQRLQRLMDNITSQAPAGHFSR